MLTLNEKSRLIIVEQSGKSVKMLITLKKDLFGCFRTEETVIKTMKTGLKEGGGIEMSTGVLSIYAMHALLRFEILTG